MRKEEEQMTLLLSREELKSTSFCLLKRRTTFLFVYTLLRMYLHGLSPFLWLCIHPSSNEQICNVTEKKWNRQCNKASHFIKHKKRST